MKNRLPEAFLERMRGQLKGEYESFIKTYDEYPHRGIRVNTLKISAEDVKKRAPFNMEPVPWVKNAFIISDEDNPAGHSFYRAGLYYIQEPSAMTPADRLPIDEGDKVLDLCAAPGGKATALAAKLNGTGMLVANDVSASRCRALLHNLELFGAANIMVTNELPQNLEKKFPAFFDKIMVDAPCSGEGMFRKEPEVADSWTKERVEFFAKQQKSILKSAVAMLKDGGLLMYSTCTFSPDEDEKSVEYLLSECDDMKLIDIEGYEGFSHGDKEYATFDDIEKTVRIWPQKMAGEGHFLALFRKEGKTDLQADSAGHDKRKNKKKDKKKRGSSNLMSSSFSRDERVIFEEFLNGLSARFKSYTYENKSGKVYMMPFDLHDIPQMRFLRCGMYMGELKKNRFEPSQALALNLKNGEFVNEISFEENDERLHDYFEGAQINLDEAEQEKKNGIILIKVSDFPVGFGKKTGEVIKSRYVRLK